MKQKKLLKKVYKKVIKYILNHPEQFKGEPGPIGPKGDKGDSYGPMYQWAVSDKTPFYKNVF